MIGCEKNMTRCMAKSSLKNGMVSRVADRIDATSVVTAIGSERPGESEGMRSNRQPAATTECARSHRVMIGSGVQPPKPRGLRAVGGQPCLRRGRIEYPVTPRGQSSQIDGLRLKSQGSLCGQDIEQLGLCRSQQIDDQGEQILVLLFGGAQDTGEHGLRPGPLFGAVAAPVLADHHQDPHDPLGHIVGGFQTGTVQEGKQVRTFVAQVFGQTLIGPIALAAGQQAVQLGFQPARGRPHPMQRDLLLPIAVPQGQGLLQELFDGQGKAGGPGGGSGANRAGISDDSQMPRFVPVEELFKGRHFNREIVVWCVRWYWSFKLSYGDLVAMMGERGIGLVHTTILRWVQHYTPEFEKRWSRFSRTVGSSWRMDET